MKVRRSTTPVDREAFEPDDEATSRVVADAIRREKDRRFARREAERRESGY